MSAGVPENVVNKKLYLSIKNRLKREMTWPSAYASGQLVKQYKVAGGKYRGRKPSKKTGLRRWFQQEEWVDVCRPKRGGGYQKCGRPTAKMSRQEYTKTYPYCRPSKRASKATPKTVRELSTSELKKRCQRKKRAPAKRVR